MWIVKPDFHVWREIWNSNGMKLILRYLLWLAADPSRGGECRDWKLMSSNDHNKTEFQILFWWICLELEIAAQLKWFLFLYNLKAFTSSYAQRSAKNWSGISLLSAIHNSKLLAIHKFIKTWMNKELICLWLILHHTTALMTTSSLHQIKLQKLLKF